LAQLALTKRYWRILCFSRDKLSLYQSVTYILKHCI